MNKNKKITQTVYAIILFAFSIITGFIIGGTIGLFIALVFLISGYQSIKKMGSEFDSGKYDNI